MALSLTPALARRIAKAQGALSLRLRQVARRASISYQERAVQEPFVDSILLALREGGVLRRRGRRGGTA